jgi:hypothetical protein
MRGLYGVRRQSAAAKALSRLADLFSENTPSLRAPQFFVIFSHEFGISIRHWIAIQRHKTLRVLLTRNFLLQPHPHLRHRDKDLFAHVIVIRSPAILPILRAQRTRPFTHRRQLIPQILRIQRLLHITHPIRPIHIIPSRDRATATAAISIATGLLVIIAIHLPGQLGQTIARAAASAVLPALTVLRLLATLAILPLSLLSILTSLTVPTLLIILPLSALTLTLLP